MLGADDCAPFSKGCALVELVSSTEPEETAVALSLAPFAVRAASPRNFFNGRADPSLAHRLLDGVELHSQRLGDLCRSGAASKTPLDLTHHILHQHRRAARHARSVESFRTLLAVDLHRPLDADRRHPKGADDIALLDMAGDAKLAGDHAKGGDVALGMAKHGHDAIEIGYLAVLVLEGQLVRDVRDPIGENG